MSGENGVTDTEGHSAWIARKSKQGTSHLCLRKMRHIAFSG